MIAALVIQSTQTPADTLGARLGSLLTLWFAFLRNGFVRVRRILRIRVSAMGTLVSRRPTVFLRRVPDRALFTPSDARLQRPSPPRAPPETPTDLVDPQHHDLDERDASSPVNSPVDRRLKLVR